MRSLTRFYVFFVIDLEKRRVRIVESHEPSGEWVRNATLSLIDAFDGFLLGRRFLTHDRDPLFTNSFDLLLQFVGIENLRLPPRSPNMNAYAERFVRSIKDECLSKVIPIGERHLRTVIEEFAEHYHLKRNH